MVEGSIAAKGTDGEDRYVMVESASRPGYYHFVDAEDETCSCKGYRRYGHCWHVESIWCAYCLGYGTIIQYPKLAECSECGGSGRAS